MRAAIVIMTLVLCLTPSFAMNVWPRVSRMLAAGAVDGGDGAIVLFQGVAVLVMAAVPFAMMRARSRGFWWAALLFGSGLASMNFLNAIEVVSHVRDSASDTRKAAILRSATLRTDLSLATESRNRVSQFTPTTAAGVASAQRGADAATAAREAECAKRGPLCRQKETDEQAALATLQQVEASRALTDQAAALDAKISALRAEMKALGDVPSHADPAAIRLARLVGLVVTLEKPEETISAWWPIIVAVAVELLAMGGPRFLLAAIGHFDEPRPPRTAPGWFWRRREPDPRSGPDEGATPRIASLAASVARPSLAPAVAKTLAPTVASVARPKMSRKSKLGDATPEGDVREFRTHCTVARPGHRVRCGEVYRAYQDWCRTAGRKPVTLSAFGRQFKCLGVGWDNRGNRASYVDIAVVGSPRLAVVKGA